MNEKVNAKLIFIVEGQETYTNTSEWNNISLQKVKVMEAILGKAQEEFVKKASS